MAQENTSESRSESTFAAALRDAIVARGVSLAWLNSRLRANGNPVSMATLSYWRSGARRPEGARSLAAIADIELLLDVEPESLAALIGPSQRVGPFGSPRFPLEGQELERAVTEVFTALGEPDHDRARDVTTHVVTEVGPTGSVVSRTVRSLVQSMSGLVTHVPYVELTPGRPTPAPTFEAIRGGRITGVHSHESGEVHGFTLELDQPIDTAETTIFEWRVSFPEDFPPSYDTGHGTSRPCREMLLWTRFHPDALPDWIQETVETPDATTSTPVTLNAGNSLHLVKRRFGPGVLSLQWGFGERE